MFTRFHQVFLCIFIISLSLFQFGCARTGKAFDVLTGNDDQTTSESTTSNTKTVRKKLTSPKPKQKRLADSSSPFRVPSNGWAWYVKDNRLRAIDVKPAILEASIGQAFKQVFLFSMYGKVAVIASGTSAFERIQTVNPTFYIRHDPANIVIGRYTIQPNRDRRFVWLLARTGSNFADIYPYEESIGFDYSKIEDGFYKIILREELEPGEYAILASDNDKAKKTVLYNFGIVENAKQETSSKHKIIADNSLVKNAQERLIDLGYDPGPVDGIFGKKVADALTTFQKNHDIPATGQLDERTIEELKIIN